MNDIPLIQKVDINSINTSIIAIKKQLKQLNEALGLVDVPSIDTSVFVKKSDVVDVVEADNMNPVTSNAVATSNAMPVDTVTSGNMHSVTSNAVNTEIGKCAYKITSSSPGNVVHYLQVTFDNYDKANEMPLVLAKCFGCLYLFGENYCKVLAGAQYGVQGLSWTAYTTDNNKYFWVKITAWRSIHILSTRPMRITAWTTTAPSGVTFVSPS